MDNEMKNEQQRAVQDKSFRFALRIVKLSRCLRERKAEYVLVNQLLRCGTSIGANVAESQQAQSKADFINKLNIALKEAYETNYWLKLLYAAESLRMKEYESIASDCSELERLLIAIIKHAKQ